ncbi:hypothetical protein P7C73_g6718, partial [Tremellales sp. Uapishka_1]
MDVTPQLTHCVTATVGTEKVHKAARIPGAKTVWVQWLQTSIAFWEKQPEEPYLVQKSLSLPTTPTTTEPAGKDFVLKGWDADDDAELEAWMNESDAEAGGETDIETESAPPTPGKKRVRYADEESLPLESFKDPSPDAGPAERPTKKRKALLLEAPPEDTGTPDANKFMYNPTPKQRAAIEESTEAEVGNGTGPETEPQGEQEEEDEFEKMLNEQMNGASNDGDEIAGEDEEEDGSLFGE